MACLRRGGGAQAGVGGQGGEGKGEAQAFSAPSCQLALGSASRGGAKPPPLHHRGPTSIGMPVQAGGCLVGVPCGQAPGPPQEWHRSRARRPASASRSPTCCMGACKPPWEGGGGAVPTPVGTQEVGLDDHGCHPPARPPARPRTCGSTCRCVPQSPRAGRWLHPGWVCWGPSNQLWCAGC